MSTVVRRLTEIAADIRVDTLPSDVIDEAKRRLLDSLGSGLGGFHAEPSQIARGLAEDLGGNPEATIWGSPHRTSCERATLANATMLRYLDFMDSHAGSDPCHPCFNIPPCLAVAERVDASGRDLIAAFVAGYEIQIRFQDSCRVGPRGWASSTYLEFSVPLAVGKLLGLGLDQMSHAAAISACHSNTLYALCDGEIPACKSSADGMAAATGIVAALLAKRGLDGPLDVIEGKAGFVNAVAHSLDVDRLLAPATELRVMEVNTKWFNTVRIGQTAVTGVFAIFEANGLGWRDIDSLVIHLPTGEHSSHIGVWDSDSRLRPKNRDSANHSPIFSVAVAAVDGVLGPEQYADGKLVDQDVLGLVDRVRLAPDTQLDPHWPEASVTRIEVTTKDGRQFEETTLYPPGHSRNRVTVEKMKEKFNRLAAPALRADKREAVIEAVDRLEELGSVRELTEHLRP